MRQLALLLVCLLFGASLVLAQADSYPLEFEYDPDSDDFIAEVEVELFEGDTLEADVFDGEDVYFYVYTDDEGLYEGESLDGFTADFDGMVYVDVVSFSEASGELYVIRADETGEMPDSSGDVPTGAAGEFIEGDCPLEVPDGVDITCGWLTVPENRQADTGATVSLPVAILAARGANPLPEPVFYLEGGPGGSALAGLDSWYTSPYLEQHDLVIFDQRGTGFSEPSLNCPEMDEDAETDAVAACRDRLLDEGVDLTAYTSRESAADIEALRVALGYDQINLYGISYGTRLALTMMRDYPDAIRAVVLDGVYPPNIDTNYNVTTDTFDLINLMFYDCLIQPACVEAFPDLETRFYEQLESLLDEPAVGVNPDGEEVTLYAEDVIGTLSQQLQTTGLISAIPASLDAFARGDFDTYLELSINGAGTRAGSMNDPVALAQELAAELSEVEIDEIREMAGREDAGDIADLLSELFDLSAEEADLAAAGFLELEAGGGIVMPVAPPEIDDDSEGMNLSVQCSEELPFMTVEEAIARAEAVPMPDVLRAATLSGTENEFAECALWPSAAPDPVENSPVVSSIPTLVLSARYDTATPPWWGDRAASSLSQSYNYHFPMIGHGVMFGGDCPVAVGMAFLADPGTEPDASCIAEMDNAFYVP